MNLYVWVHSRIYHKKNVERYICEKVIIVSLEHRAYLTEVYFSDNFYFINAYNKK
jgi:hypothetical protein